MKPIKDSLRTAWTLAAVLPLALVLKVAAAAATGGPASVSLHDILAGFINRDMLIFSVCLGGFLAFEACAAGWKRSALRRLTVAPSTQARGDVVLVLFTFSGGMAAVITLLSFGMADLAQNTLAAHSTTGLLAQAPAWLAGPLLYLAMTFCNYWTHRLLHTPALWPLHAFHHAPTQFTVMNGVRASLAEPVIISLFQALPAALFGASPEAILVSSLIAGNESLWTHSNIRGLHWLERFGITPPEAHMIHHSREPRFHNRNFGDLLCLWDKVFGTYVPAGSVDGPVELGVDDPHGVYKFDRPLAGWLHLHWIWLRGGFKPAAPLPQGAR